MDPVRLVNVIRDWPGATLVPPASLKLDLETAPGGKAVSPAAKPSAASGPTAAAGHQNQQGSRRPLGAKAPAPGAQSWWTARATAGEVTSGFTKEEILRKPEADPRAAGGMFSRLEQLLRALG